MCKIISICNQKGGCSKSTVAENLGIGLARMGKKVLLMDVDPQGSLTASLGYQEPDDIPVTLATIMTNIINEEDFPVDEGILHHEEGVDLLPANIELSGLEVSLANTMSREMVLREYVELVRDRYDYIILDCMPSLGVMTINALVAADSVLIPVQAAYLPVKGLQQLMKTITVVKKRLNTDVYAKYMNLNSNIKRMDSLMIASNCKRMSRLEIIYTTVSNAVRLFHELGLDERIPSSLIHYLDDDDRNKVIYYCKSEDVTSRLDKVISEAVTMKDLMTDDEFLEMSQYQLLIRVLKEQTDEDVDGNVTAKPKSNISPDSLQNPSDPDVTYCSKAGKDNKGYVGNVVETVGEHGNSLITDASYEVNSHSDSTFCKEHLNKRDDTSEHETVIADGAYGGVENRKLAESKNVTLVTTALTGKETDPIFAEFKLSDDGTKVLSCPCGYSPIKTTYYPKTGMCRALFPVNCCEHCPNRDRCKVKQQRKSYAVHVSSKMASRAEYCKKLSSEEYRSLARKRNAIEGIPSVFRRRYHVDQIPVRGLKQFRIFFYMKVAAYNFNKLNNYYRHQQVESALAAANA